MRRGDVGSATVYASFAIAVLAVSAVIALQVATLSRLQHSVSSAADLAALAAVGAAVDGDDGCGAAAMIARRNDAELRTCTMNDHVATVDVTGTSPRMWGRTWTITSRARAAPGDYVRPD